MDQPVSQSFLHRHEFLLRRLHSLSGLIPVGAYMCVHLAVNASINNGAATFQDSVYRIHGLGSLLLLVEWGFIFLPILFHAIFGVVIIAGGLPNTGSYAYRKNYRYTLQRATGMIAFAFIVLHVFHLHGWFHIEAWESFAKAAGGKQFDPYNAASSLGRAMSGFGWQAFYAVGVLACVYHLANGLWTMGITWGLWVSPQAQRRADRVCIGFGLLLTVVAFAAWMGAIRNSSPEAIETNRAKEDQMFEHRVQSGILDRDSAQHKRTHDDDHAGDGEDPDDDDDDPGNGDSDNRNSDGQAAGGNAAAGTGEAHDGEDAS